MTGKDAALFRMHIIVGYQNSEVAPQAQWNGNGWRDLLVAYRKLALKPIIANFDGSWRTEYSWVGVWWRWWESGTQLRWKSRKTNLTDNILVSTVEKCASTFMPLGEIPRYSSVRPAFCSISIHEVLWMYVFIINYSCSRATAVKIINRPRDLY